MITIFARVADYDRARAGLPWALAIAAYACLTHRKKRARRREEPEGAAPAVPLGDAPADEQLEQRELIDAALSAMDHLSDLDRETLLATYWEERRASAAGATLRKRRERALDRLRNVFRRLYGLG